MINNKKVEKKLNNIPFLSPCCTLLTRCPVPIFWEIKTSHRLKKKELRQERKGKRLNAVRRSCRAKLATEKKWNLWPSKGKGGVFCASFCLVSLSFFFFLDHSRIFGCGSVSSWCCQNLDIFLCLTFCCIKWRLNLSRQTKLEHKLEKKRSRRVLRVQQQNYGGKKKKTKKKKTVLKKSKDFFLFVFFLSCLKYLLCKYVMSRVRSAKCVFSAAKTLQPKPSQSYAT